MDKKVMIMVLAGVVLAVALSGGVVYFVMKSALKDVAKGGGETKETTTESATLGQIVQVGEFIANLADDGGGRFLKISISLEVAAKEGEESSGGKEGEAAAAPAEVTERLPLIRDRVLAVLRGKRAADFSDRKGELLLRKELLTEINKIMPSTTKFKNVFFTDLVVQ